VTKQQLFIYFLVGIMVFSALGTGLLLLTQGTSNNSTSQTDEAQQVCQASADVANQPGNPAGEWPTTSPDVTELQITDLRVGTGQAAAVGNCITVHYRLSLSNGTPIEGNDTFESGQPIAFELSPGGLIEGWIQGIPGLQEGGVRRLVLPPDMAYGAAERPGIPANSTLIFDVELLKVEF